MTKRILIDGVHAEETRIVVAEGNRLEEFDFENIEKKQIKNSIFLGKITRIEPSLQAAFVEYGGNRQGFLPFSEIHPDYFNIPQSDQQIEQTKQASSGSNDDDGNNEASNSSSSDSDRNNELEVSNTEETNSKDKINKNTDSIDKSIDESLSDEDKNNTIAADADDDTKSTVIKIDDISDSPKSDLTETAIKSTSKKEDITAKKEGLTTKKTTDKKAATSKQATKRTYTKRKKKDEDIKDKNIAVEKSNNIKDKEGKISEESSAILKKRTKKPKIIKDKVKKITNIDLSSKKKAEFLARRYSEADWLSDYDDKKSQTQPPTGSIKKGRGDNSFDKISNVMDSDNLTESDIENEEGQENIIIDIPEDDIEEGNRNKTDIYKKYKIQEVLKRGQVILVQVIKEERGNKGASLTSYISLAGRYCVLMPNNERGGGVSRRISDIEDRRRLKKIVDGLGNSDNMGVIVRTAGINKAEAEITADYNNLKNLWKTIKATTMQAQAPELVYEDGNLIKFTLRDMYKNNVEEIVVEGEQAYKDTIKYMEMMAPEDVHKVRLHKENKPLFKCWNIESQLDELYNNEAALPSGGSIVISPTEALVSIDVNSGKATREKNIEDTALKTNIEAAQEVARQLRLRDLAGLVVIDFIDMRDIKNRRAVEKVMKDALKVDRAKIQVGRISLFGLMEMSRQRMRSSIVEASSITCPHCKGNGMVRSNESVAINLLRAIEAEATKANIDFVVIKASSHATSYILNNKREEIIDIEKENGVKVEIVQDYDLLDAAYIIDRQKRGKYSYNKKQSAKYNKKPANNRNLKPKVPRKKYSNAEKENSTESINSTNDIGVDGNQISNKRTANRSNNKNNDDKRSSYKDKGYKDKRNNKKPVTTKTNNRANYSSSKKKEKPIDDDIGNRIEGNTNKNHNENTSNNNTEVDLNENSKIRSLWNKMTK